MSKSPFSTLHLLDNSLCSSSEIYFVFEKSILPSYISFTEINGTPDSMYVGVWCVPSTIFDVNVSIYSSGL